MPKFWKCDQNTLIHQFVLRIIVKELSVVTRILTSDFHIRAERKQIFFQHSVSLVQ